MLFLVSLFINSVSREKLLNNDEKWGPSIKAFARSHREAAHSGDQHDLGGREAYDIVGAWHAVYCMPSLYPAVKRTVD